MLHRVLNGHASVSSNMDLRLSEALSTSPGYGLALQTQRDLWRVTCAQASREVRLLP